MAENKLVVNVAVKSEFRKAMNIAAEVIRGKMETHAKEDYLTPRVYDRPETWYKRLGVLRNRTTTGKQEDSAGNIEIAVGTNVEYAKYVELGTGNYAEGEGGSRAKKIPWHFKDADGNWHTTSGVPARPFLRPAVENHAEEYKAILEKVLRGT